MADTHTGGSGAATTASNAIPRVLNLSATRPNATQAYSREFRTYPVNGTSFDAGGTIRINIDTSTPGAFLDPNITYLQFDFTVKRTNTNNSKAYALSVKDDDLTYKTQAQWNESAEYYRLPNCGANVFIQEFRIYVQGVPIEEIVDYNLVCELMHDLQGIPTNKFHHATNLYYANGYPSQRMNGSESEVVSQQDRMFSNTEVNELRLGQTYRCQIQFMSGVLGSLADKMFPSMLVAPGSMYIEIRLCLANNCAVSFATEKKTFVKFTETIPITTTTTVGETTTTTTTNTDFNQTYYIGSQHTSNVANATKNYYAGQSNYQSSIFVEPVWNANNGVDEKDIALDPAQARVRYVPTGDLTSNTLSYKIENVQLVMKQVVLTDTVASAIISRAASSDISIHTNSFRTYATQATGALKTAYQDGQSYQLLIPAKVASANSLFVIFRDRKQTQQPNMDFLKRQAIGLNPLGNGCSYQLRIGNELIPQTPINTPNEAMMQLLRAMHDYPNINHSSMFGQIKSYGYGGDAVENDFSHPLIQYPCPGWLTVQREGRGIWTAEKNTDNTNAVGDYSSSYLRPWSTIHGHNFNEYPSTTYEPYFYSTFAIGFDLDSFANNADVMRSGKYLGNNTVQLLLNNCKVSPCDMQEDNTTPAIINYIVGHDVRLSFQAGGVVQSFY